MNSPLKNNKRMNRLLTQIWEASCAWLGAETQEAQAQQEGKDAKKEADSTSAPSTNGARETPEPVAARQPSKFANSRRTLLAGGVLGMQCLCSNAENTRSMPGNIRAALRG
jgi:hypothetical protein